ncbi:galactosyltransferase-related protein [Paraburkholderia phenazinium]|uniref:galactosyltransferase-related protein n=1 Tax=Paraburkholderia phenazinium TaxID=60549 RepID=UPI001588BBCC|nr:galactosyltransferase-related protein [Paraburkholderia phenazinium]
MNDNKISLRALEIIITYRGATTDRMVNLRSILRHLDRTYTDYTLWVVEADREPTFHWSEVGDDKVRHVFVCDEGPFSRAKLCNLGARLSRSPIICFHDADMIAHPAALKHCLDDLLNNSERDAWGPYERIVNVAGDLRTRFCETGDYALLDPYSEPTATLDPEMNILYMTNASGVTLIRRERFFELGGFDAAFVGWGGEDDDLLSRALRLGMGWYSLHNKFLFHLNHDSKTRAGWDQTPTGSENCNRSVALRELSDEAFHARIEQLRREV